MSSFLCSVNCLPQAWLLVGQAVRAGQDLGLHVSGRLFIFYTLITDRERSVRHVGSPSLQLRKKLEERFGGVSTPWIACWPLL